MILHSGIRDDGNNFQIVPSTRKIVVPPSHKVIGTVGSHNSEQTTFQCPRTIDGHDVASCSDHFICWINANGVYGRYDIENISVDDEYMYLTWVIDSGVTASAGNVSFAVHFEDKDADNKLLYSWGTAECTECEILSTIKGASGTSNNGSIVVGGTLDISKNGVYDVSNYAYVNVRVAGDSSGSDDGEVKTYRIITNLTNVTSNAENITEIASNTGAILKFTANDGYTLPSNIIVTGCNYIWNNLDGNLAIAAGATGNITITIVGVKTTSGDDSGDSGGLNRDISVTYNLTGVTTNGTNIIPVSLLDTTVSIVFTAKSGYKLPSVVTVSGCSYQWQKSTGTLYIENFTDDVIIKVVGVVSGSESDTRYYNISTNFSNVRAGILSESIVSSGNEVSEMVIEAYDGYRLPTSITVTGCSYTWGCTDENTTTASLYLSKATGNVTVTIVGEKVNTSTVWGTFTFGDNDLGGYSFSDDAEGKPYVRYKGVTYYGISFDSIAGSDGFNDLVLIDEDGFYTEYLYSEDDDGGWIENPLTLEFLVEPSATVKTFINTYKNDGEATEYTIKAGTYTLHNDGRNGNTTGERCVIFDSEEVFYCEGYSDGFEFGVEEDGSLFVEGGDCYILPSTNTITVYEDVTVSKTYYDIFRYYID